MTGAPAAVRVDALAMPLPPSPWQVAQLQEGSKGPLEAELAFVRSVGLRDDLRGPDVWVVLRRALDTTRTEGLPEQCRCRHAAGDARLAAGARMSWSSTTTRCGASVVGTITRP